MRTWIRTTAIILGSILSGTTITSAQNPNQDRMVRDIEVAENVLATLIKQEVNQRGFFGIDINGSYQEGYGVTFRLPLDFAMVLTPNVRGTVIYSDEMAPSIAISRSEAEARRSEEAARSESKNESYKLKEKSALKRKALADSTRDEYYAKVIKASKDFVVDYGDFISQLGPNERIVVTNRGENRSWYFQENNRSHISVEALKADLIAFRQGKISRDQMLAKVKVVNTQYVEEKEVDLELLVSIFSRLYRSDLSETFFTENSLYYERLKDYGAIIHMPVYSSSQTDFMTFSMPTQGLDDIDEETKNKKIVELYPKFLNDLKANILQYGHTAKNLKDEEVLIFDIAMTKCKGCGIPSTLELSVKSSVLRDFNAGKIDKKAAMEKFVVKNGPKQ